MQRFITPGGEVLSRAVPNPTLTLPNHTEADTSTTSSPKLAPFPDPSVTLSVPFPTSPRPFRTASILGTRASSCTRYATSRCPPQLASSITVWTVHSEASRFPTSTPDRPHFGIPNAHKPLDLDRDTSAPSTSAARNRTTSPCPKNAATSSGRHQYRGRGFAAPPSRKELMLLRLCSDAPSD
ncbi:hypothetical protein B0T14DRAFT_500536 [Immersiella caudata]|uniref:Uncharacterized protein n=1 Tax=Immersiella caudata TaxID=314043 RepID=A0AA39TXZ8_9PEZI|nr:hypothetical protein B0T14DRAFT_500536 [Immersiella caudata]